MTVLYLTHTCPYPPNKGDRIRSFNILRYLSTQFEVKLLYPSFSGEDFEQVENLRSYCQSVKTVKLKKSINLVRCLLNFMKNRPLTEAFFYSKRLANLISEEEYDVVLVDCSSMAQYVMNIPGQKLLDFVDVDSDKWRSYAKASCFPKSYVYSRECRRIEELEGRILKQFDAAFVVSENEKKLLPSRKKVLVMRNGIDLNFFKPKKAFSSEENTIIFTGAMDYFPNVDGVLYFHKEILPLIKMHLPQVKFIVAGMNPTAAIKLLAREGIIVTGYVRDIREYLSKATLCVVPLRHGRGIQNKVLEAMAMKVPVVATSLANQGIGARNAHEIFIADTSQAFSESVVNGLVNPQLRAKVAKKARIFVENEFCWEKSLRVLTDAILNLRR